jgi:UDP:flavonoid glycosyltransferase YjiC (YdhE family)
MKVLILAGPSYGLLFPLVPMAWALRGAGHEILVATPENAQPAVTAIGLPAAAAAPPLEINTIMMTDRAGAPLALPGDEAGRIAHIGAGFGKLAAVTVGPLTDLARDWQPDLIVGAAPLHAAGLAARRLGVPWVRYAVDMGNPPALDEGAAAELAPELAADGLDGLPAPEVFLDSCPPSARRADAPPAQAVRYVPYNSPGPVEPALFAQRDRPRVLLTLGSRIAPGKPGGVETLGRLAAALAGLGADIVVAATEQASAALGPLPAGVRAGWAPLDVLIPQCDLVVHHAGGNTMLAALAAGRPQVLLPYMAAQADMSRRLDNYGAAM